MRDLLYVLRFFAIVAPTPPLMVPAMIGAGAVAAGLAAWDADGARGALTPLMVLQIFAASSGFMVPARRGHYDLLLTAGYGRRRIAAAHWAASVVPGLAVLMGVALVDVAAAGGSARVLAGGTIVAFALASTVPWAATVALPRFTAAIAWLLLVTVVAAIYPPAFSTALVDPLASAAVVLYPVAVVGVEISLDQVPRVAPACLLAVGSLAAALAWIGRQDIPLEAPQ